MTLLQDEKLKEYEEYSQKVVKNILKSGVNGSGPDGVAKTIYQAATDNSKKLRYLTGNSKEMVSMRAMLPQQVFASLVRSAMEK
jgi:hypothetical protein